MPNEKIFSVDNIELCEIKIDIEKAIDEVEQSNIPNYSLLSYSKEKKFHSHLWHWNERLLIEENLILKKRISQIEINNKKIKRQSRFFNSPGESKKSKKNKDFHLKIVEVEDDDDEDKYGDPFEKKLIKEQEKIIMSIKDGTRPQNKKSKKFESSKDLNAVFLTKGREKNLLSGFSSDEDKKHNTSPDPSNHNINSSEQEYSSYSESSEALNKEDDDEEEKENVESTFTSELPLPVQDINELMAEAKVLDLSEFKKRVLCLKNFGEGIESRTVRTSGTIYVEHELEPMIKRMIDNKFIEIDKDVESKNLKKIVKISGSKKEETKSVEPKSLKKLRISSFLILLSIVVYSIVDFIFNINANEVMVENFDLINTAYESVNEYVYSHFLIRNMILANNNNYTNYLNYNHYNSFQKMNLDLLIKSNDNIQYIISNISLSFLELSQEQKNILYDNSVPLYYLDTEKSLRKSNITLINAMSLVIIIKS